MTEPRIHVDFNGVQEDGRLVALRRYADDPLAVEVGSTVLLWDEDGNNARGVVVETGERDILQIDLLPDSWQPHLQGSSGHALVDAACPQYEAVLFYVMASSFLTTGSARVHQPTGRIPYVLSCGGGTIPSAAAEPCAA